MQRRRALQRIARGYWIRRDVPLFLLVGASVGIAGHRLLLVLLHLGVAPVVANAVQAVLTLQLNFVANSLITWRKRTSGSTVPVRVRWLRFQVARLASLLLSVALFVGLGWLGWLVREALADL